MPDALCDSFYCCLLYTSMAKTEIAPAVSSYVLELANTAVAKQTVDALISCRYENDLLKKLSLSLIHILLDVL